MTILLKQASVNHPTRSKSEEQVFVFDSQSLELLNCTVFERLPAKQKVMIGAEVFKNRSQVSIRNDLIDCQIDICSVEVLALFTENFDYQDIRRDFLTGILESDILGKTIYCHLIEGYAAAASTMQMYHSISKDILMRWTYPLTPDNFCQGEESYSFGAHNIYKGHDLQLDRSVQLHRSVVIGSNSVMGKQCSVTNSVIGKNCIIGKETS
jgi:translation initiation factor eIF-2B subunit epsilon